MSGALISLSKDRSRRGSSFVDWVGIALASTAYYSKKKLSNKMKTNWKKVFKLVYEMSKKIYIKTKSKWKKWKLSLAFAHWAYPSTSKEQSFHPRKFSVIRHPFITDKIWNGSNMGIMKILKIMKFLCSYSKHMRAGDANNTIIQ